MSVRKRVVPSGKTRWFVDILLPNGNRFRKTVGSKKQADQVHKQIESDVVEGKWSLRETDDVSFSKLVSEYLEYSKTAKAQSTYNVDQYRIKAHLLKYFKDMPIKCITSQMIDAYKGYRVNEGATNNTVNHEVTNLSHMMRMAIRWRYLDTNPVASVDRLKVPKRSPRFLNIEEIERLMAASKESYIYPLIMTALHTGMRKSELFNLRWTDVNFQQGTIAAQNRSDWHTKNYLPRTISMTPALHEVLQGHQTQQTELGYESEYVFTYQGNQLKYDIKDSLRTVLRKAGLKNVTLHTFRHTFASQLALAGVPLRDIQELMGHQSFQTTLQYAHLSEEHVKKQVMRLPFANHPEKSMAH